MQSRVWSLTLRPTRDAARKSVMRTCAPDTCLSLGGSKREFIFLSRESGAFAPGRGSLEFTETNGDVAERRVGVFGFEERDWRSFSHRGETVFCQGSNPESRVPPKMIFLDHGS
jgi:hypothetical protein